MTQEAIPVRGAQTAQEMFNSLRQEYFSKEGYKAQVSDGRPGRFVARLVGIMMIMPDIVESNPLWYSAVHNGLTLQSEIEMLVEEFKHGEKFDPDTLRKFEVALMQSKLPTRIIASGEAYRAP